MVTEEQRGKIEATIAQLEKSKKQQEGALATEEAFNRTAWSTYGSELCGGEMMAKERRIAARIEETANDIALLRQCLSGEVPVEIPESDNVRLREIEAQTTQLAEEAASINKRRVAINRVRLLSYL